MLRIGENIHIISKKTRQAILDRDSDFIKKLAQKQIDTGVDYLELNIGPARKQEGTMEWLINTIDDIVSCPISLDTTNISEMKAGLKLLENKPRPLLNSTSGDPERLNTIMQLAADFNTTVIGLAMDTSGIPKDPDGRLEIAMRIIDKASEFGIDNDRIFLDPLVLPISGSQDQALESLNSIRVFKESFDPPVKTIIGLSNVSNGSPKENRALINRVFLVLAMGCGLDAAIVDAFDNNITNDIKVIKTNKPICETDKLILNLYNMMSDFGELEDINFDQSDPEQIMIYKTAQILLNKNIYAHNYISV